MVKKKKGVGVRDLSLKYVRITQFPEMCVRDLKKNNFEKCLYVEIDTR